MTFSEDDLIPISGLQHLVFCERQAALIHVEGHWADNAHTVVGSHMHNRVHMTGPRRERRGDLIIVRGLALRSLELGIVGIADVVEFHRCAAEEGVRLDGVSGWWMPFPVEYKKGRPKAHRADEVQLCAQAICLEEYFHCPVQEGALFYGKEQRRTDVLFDDELRASTVQAAMRFREIVVRGETPPAEYGKKCASCSLKEVCLPEASGEHRSARRFLDARLAEIETETRGTGGSW